MEESITQTMQTKFCPTCGETKPITEFSRNRAAKDGHQSQCKACKNKLAKEKRDAHKSLIFWGGRQSTNRIYPASTDGGACSPRLHRQTLIH